MGTLGVVDDDVVDLSNLQRQVIHGSSTLGEPKAESAKQRIAEINPDVTVEVHRTRITAENAMALVSDYDLVADGSDNFATRYLVNDACYLAKKPLVTAAIMRFDGQITTIRAYDEKGGPCYRCLFGDQPEADPKMSCADVGVMGALAGVMGSLQASEVVKEITGAGESLTGKLILFDALATRFTTLTSKADPSCPLCGKTPSITEMNPDLYRPEICAAE